MYKLIYLFLVVFISLGCQQGSSEIIDADQLKKLQSEGVVVIDIRTLNEYKKGHIPGVIHIDYYSDDFVDLMVKYRDQPIIIHCAVGGRSGASAKLLLKEGFQKVYDYAGGFSDWKRLGEKVEK